MTRVLFWIVAIMQAADVATTYIGSIVVEGFYEVNPIVVALAGQPPILWKLIALKLVVLGIVWVLCWLEKDRPVPMRVVMGLAIVAYTAIVWNNIHVIL